MENLLEQAKWTGPSTNHPPHKAADDTHGANNIKTDEELTIFNGHPDPGKELLQRTKEAICRRRWAGITIQSWRADDFERPLIDAS